MNKWSKWREREERRTGLLFSFFTVGEPSPARTEREWITAVCPLSTVEDSYPPTHTHTHTTVLIISLNSPGIVILLTLPFRMRHIISSSPFIRTRPPPHSLHPLSLVFGFVPPPLTLLPCHPFLRDTQAPGWNPLHLPYLCPPDLRWHLSLPEESKPMKKSREDEERG